ncbi:hypothetical protein LFYK43_05120 [Ligilactobacillus salitolerans]|uniref:NERD domain-containing protein n=1 Tax=Ligilactobacillus salitolerans TaxID=1808352 RepID=A0A401IR91_9LACO|nr:nuclease-related domain-containing protein [Ligilactobacillus salitolerans]GBG94053.1 hypothetical protein LFYK43_05120 [Ligilactobacillus salitolerans]
MRSKSNEFQYLEVLNERTKLTVRERDALNACQKGYGGEVYLDQAVQLVAQGADSVWDDLNLNYLGQRIQIDKLLQIGSTLYLIDVKNYHGHYTYRDRTWYCNGKPTTHSIFNQIDRAHDVLARILFEQHVNLQIVKVLVFLDSTATIDVQEQTGIVTKYLWDFCDWIQKILRENRDQLQFLGNWQKVLQPYVAEPYRQPEDFTANPQRPLRQGIVCPKCFGNQWNAKRYFYACQRCGFCQTKEEAYVRTICDYGTLYFKKELCQRDLQAFLGDEYSSKYLRKILCRHFEWFHETGWNSYYLNKGVRFEDWFDEKMGYFQDVRRRIEWKSSPN